MDQRAVAVTALAGATAGLLFLSVTEGGGLLPAAGYLVQLPLLLCGLGIGPLSAGLASAGALLLTLLASGLAATLVLLVVQVAPALLVSHRALLWRRAGEAVEWYPLGRLAADTVLYVGAVALLALLWVETGTQGIEALARAFAAHLAAHLGDGPSTTALEALFASWLGWLPAIVALSWLLMIWGNAGLAQALLARSGHARRPTPPLALLDAPRWAVPALLLALALGWLAPGAPVLAAALGIVAALSGALVFLGGLAVLHALVAHRRLGRAPLVLLYLLLVLFSWPLVLVVVLLGVVEELAGLRRRLA